MIKLNRKSTLIIAAALLLFSCIWLTVRLWPDDAEDLKASHVKVEHTCYYTITSNGKPTLYLASLSKDTLMEHMAWNKDSILKNKRITNGYWTNRTWLLPSCKGRLITMLTDTADIDAKGVDIKQLITSEIDTLKHIVRVRTNRKNNLGYYLRVHGVQDEGFDVVAKYDAENQLKLDSAIRCLAILEKYDTADCSKIKIKKHEYWEAVTKTKSDDNENTYYERHPLRLIEPLKDNFHFALFQTTNKKTPKEAHAISKKPAFISSHFDMKDATYLASKHNILVSKIDTSFVKYFGDKNKEGLYHGHGTLIDKEENIYEGQWKDGERNGWGVAISDQGRLRVGEWKNDRYQGERLHYTSDRIYGIDISKYQHVIGKKIYSIDWKNLRITSLGKISKKKISGTIDYPISYIYIKSTEGSTLLNPYYKADYRAAKAHGYHVGTYHFFSTTSSAVAQAHQFLKHSHIQKGDFPPVLDVEPSHQQIEKMGGVRVMFNRIRHWLKIVEEQTGKRPILYISQTFVNNYLPSAPDLKSKYQVWIARYGEYKPDVRLVYWQLCPDGRVRGIHGEVDINVFNGYKNEFKSYVSGMR